MEIKITGLDALMTDLKDFPKAMERAARNAENTAATAIRKDGVKTSSEVFNIKQARIKTDSRGRPTSWIKRSSPSQPYAVVSFRGGDSPKDGDRPGLQHFKVDKQERNKKQKGWSPSYKIKHSGQTEQVERGFYGVGKLKGQGIFQRREEGRKIVRRTGPSAKQMVSTPEVYQQVEARATATLMQKLIEAVDKQLAKIRK